MPLRCSGLLKYFLYAFPGLVMSLLVSFACIRCFTCPHETMSRTFINHRFKGLASFLHQLLGLFHCRGHPRIVSSIESVNRAAYSLNLFFILRPCSVENHCSFDLLVIGC